MKSLIALIAILSLPTVSMAEWAELEQVEVGALKCHLVAGTTEPGQTLTDVYGIGTKEIYRRPIEVPIYMPKECQKNPDLCEGGPVKTAYFKDMNEIAGTEVRWILRYEDGWASAEIRTPQAAAYDDALRLELGGGPSLQIQDTVYTFSCSEVDPS